MSETPPLVAIEGLAKDLRAFALRVADTAVFLDKLFEKQSIADSEREAIAELQKLTTACLAFAKTTLGSLLT